MIWISDGLAALAISQLLVLGLVFLLHYRNFLGGLMALFCVCLTAYLLSISSVVEPNTLPNYALARLATLAPILLWLIAEYLFVDARRIPVLAWTAIGYYIIARLIGTGLNIIDPQLTTGGPLFLVLVLIPQLVLLVFPLHAFYLAYRGYSADLLEQRRRLRVAFVAFMGAIIAVIVGMSIVNYFAGREVFPSYLYSLSLFLVTLVFNVLAFRLSDNAESIVSGRQQATSSEEPETDSLEPETVQAIRHLMEEEQLYTQPGLTIAELAEALSVQEYRLRRIINRTMQHKNFNQFLNTYRIEDASQRLLESKLPVSRIALDVGYSSLSVFNKAFKERFGVTPTEYRNQYRAQSLRAKANTDAIDSDAHADQQN
ncbi:MAG: helix-turn-helix domain-containing protein [Pseudohongiellaceae bacterium]|jgi:AraC-like DNA-binding protein